ncbi:hypothetical protein [Gayadomonas joobiniege]|uniref:hypothetical protein n=1 Tax=Gayadomonas joobiniege TaxID=1234606 RepID=UPI0003620F85|nr:hypothetical protein [Gayadomonas joobiniege]
MADNSIEVLGQKFCYPTTWQGTLSVFIVCVCIGFLGYVLDADKINSYSSLFNGKTEEAYNESIETIAKLNQQIEEMQGTINNLTKKSNLATEEKVEIYTNLENKRKTREDALLNLKQVQADRIQELNKIESAIPPQQQSMFYLQQQKIDKQLGNIQQQQQQQIQQR